MNPEQKNNQPRPEIKIVRGHPYLFLRSVRVSNEIYHFMRLDFLIILFSLKHFMRGIMRLSSIHITRIKQTSIVAIVLLISFAASSQKKYTSLAGFTTQTAMPFGKFAGLFADQFHPGIEAGYGINMSVKEKHDWFVEFKIACFYHRFVQTGIPLYANLGYRYKFSNRFNAETSLGAGYMHSIPATAKLKLNEDGVYVNNKGVGRMQAMATFGLGLGYTIDPSAKKPLSVFTTYQQRIQMPFVRSYVPLLPYNSFIIGVKKSIK